MAAWASGSPTGSHVMVPSEMMPQHLICTQRPVPLTEQIALLCSQPCGDPEAPPLAPPPPHTISHFSQQAGLVYNSMCEHGHTHLQGAGQGLACPVP